MLEAKNVPFWNDLEVRIKNTKTLIEPETVLGKGDHLIGEMDAWMRRFYTVTREMLCDLEMKSKRVSKLQENMSEPEDRGVLAELRSIYTSATPKLQDQARELERLLAETYLELNE